MAHPYHHALSSVKKWGGTVDDFMAVHAWFDQSKEITADFRHRALRHHAEGIFMAETIFGPTLTLSTGRIIPTRWVGESDVCNCGNCCSMRCNSANIWSYAASGISGSSKT